MAESFEKVQEIKYVDAGTVDFGSIDGKLIFIPSKNFKEKMPENCMSKEIGRAHV